MFKLGMAHVRKRLLTDRIKKELRFWPIITLLGPRQCGKSTLLRELLFEPEASSYVSLDRINQREAARLNPELFLSQFSDSPVVIDEAHKAPPLFDEIKASVDEDRRPGRFILSGSIRFSSKLGIRESFTGRAANLRLDSLTLAETTGNSKLSLPLLRKYFQQGGMPGVCFLRDPAQIRGYWQEWLETTCQRDLLEWTRGRLDGDLAYHILEAVCSLEFPDAAAIAKLLRVDTRRIKTHLEGLEALFLIRPWNPSRTSVGKTFYLPFDCGLAAHFKASPRRLWQTWFAHQTLNSYRIRGEPDPDLKFHLTARKSFADFVSDESVYLYLEEAYPSPRSQITLKALARVYPDKRIIAACATDQPKQKVGKSIQVIGWSQLFPTSGNKSKTI